MTSAGERGNARETRPEVCSERGEAVTSRGLVEIEECEVESRHSTFKSAI